MNPRYWTPEDDAAITAPDACDDELVARLGRSLKGIKLRRWRLTTGRVHHDRPRGRPANSPEDLWKWVKIGGPYECWPWTGAKRRRGYGAWSLDGKNLVAHRAAYQLATGHDPAGLLVCHSCDNPPCCNPAHLFVGTALDNVRDMLSKGRGRAPHGEDHHYAKLTAEKVQEIRRRRAAGEKLIDLAAEFGVRDSRLSVICKHPDKAWRHVA